MISLLSPEDLLWVKALAERVMFTYRYEYSRAYNIAYRAVERFYQDSRNVREDDIELRLKRLSYELETAKLRQRLSACRAKDNARRAKHESLQDEFDEVGGRNRWVFVQYYFHSRKPAYIGSQLGISRNRVYQILQQELDRECKRWRRVYTTRVNKGRPIDMGGPRNVWVDDDCAGIDDGIDAERMVNA